MRVGGAARFPTANREAHWYGNRLSFQENGEIGSES